MGGGNQELGSIHIDKKRKKGQEAEMLRRRSSNVYCPHNGVLCREEDLTLSAVCSSCTSTFLSSSSSSTPPPSSSSSTGSVKPWKAVKTVRFLAQEEPRGVQGVAEE